MRRGAELTRPAAPAVSLHAATAGDCRIVWQWRNEEETRRASFDSSAIPYDAHRAWFAESLTRPDRAIYIVRAGGEPCGVVRLDLAPPEASVSIFLTRARHGRGIGPAALDAAAEIGRARHGLDRLVALVKPDNRRSLAAFARAGFAPCGSASGAVRLVRHLGEGAR